MVVSRGKFLADQEDRPFREHAQRRGELLMGGERIIAMQGMVPLFFPVVYGSAARQKRIMLVMKNPFPGMNPYCESRWRDFHTRFVAYAADQLNTRLPGNLVASTEERLEVVEEDSGESGARDYQADVYVAETDTGAQRVASPAEAGTKPLRLVASEPAIERFIEIMESGSERVVTVIELVSPSNKIGEGLAAFKNKRSQLLASGVNVVEIDLSRRGDWRRLLKPQTCPRKKESHYRVVIRHANEPDVAYVFPIALAQAPPEVPIPLREGEAAVGLDLRPLVNAVYENGKYHQRLDYSKPPPEPGLSAEEEAWCGELLAGLRGNR
jgi:hypothetical protein